MKRLLSWLTGALVMASLIAGLVLPNSVYADDDLRGKYSGNKIRNVVDDKIAEREGKVDLNNSSVRRFQQFPGMYPTMAGKIVLGGPYDSVDDVLSLDLTDRQKELFNKYHSAERTVGFPIDCQVSAEIGLQKASEEGRNVIAHLQVGEKPSAEKIMIGAHIDHLGYGKRGSSRAGGDRSEQLHPGADDNASGVAAIMEIAQFFADKKRNGDITLKRDLVFAGWSGEEMGLFGSKHYVAKAGKNGDLYPKTAAYLNMDMVGRLGKNPLNVMATGSSKDWKGIIDSLDKELKIKISPNPNLPTDSTSFYSGGVPVIALFTGLHDEYHTPDDTPDKIDFNGLNRITHYLENLTSTVANLDAPPTYLKSARREEQKPTKLVIGVRIENVPDNSGVKILETLPGSPAQKAGIRKGDIIEQIDGRKTNDIKGLREALNKLEAGKQYSTGVKRGNKLMLLEMTPEKSR